MISDDELPNNQTQNKTHVRNTGFKLPSPIVRERAERAAREFPIIIKQYNIKMENRRQQEMKDRKPTFTLPKEIVRERAERAAREFPIIARQLGM